MNSQQNDYDMNITSENQVLRAAHGKHDLMAQCWPFTSILCCPRIKRNEIVTHMNNIINLVQLGNKHINLETPHEQKKIIHCSRDRPNSCAGHGKGSSIHSLARGLEEQHPEDIFSFLPPNKFSVHYVLWSHCSRLSLFVVFCVIVFPMIPP